MQAINLAHAHQQSSKGVVLDNSGSANPSFQPPDHKTRDNEATLANERNESRDAWASWVRFFSYVYHDVGTYPLDKVLAAALPLPYLLFGWQVYVHVGCEAMMDATVRRPSSDKVLRS